LARQNRTSTSIFLGVVRMTPLTHFGFHEWAPGMVKSERQDSKAEVVEFIIDMTAQLAELASDARCSYLAYLLKMANLEGREIADRSARPQGRATDSSFSRRPANVVKLRSALRKNRA
jgi:hypothetical protein